MNRAKVKKVAWTMRIIGLGLLFAAGGMVLVGASRASGTDTRSAVTLPATSHAPGQPDR